MTAKYLYLFLLAVVAINTVASQNADELQIPVENDNQFPPDKLTDGIDGSGDGVIDEPGEVYVQSTTGPPPIEQIKTKFNMGDVIGTPITEDDDNCPKPCVCHIEGNTNDFVVDCSGYGLTEFPTPINEKTTILNIQKNKLKEIPKEISTLKSLRVLNAHSNSLENMASGSVSELPALVKLNLGNNRLIEYPQDLKNSFGLTKLEELDLGGNDMRTPLSSDFFLQFQSLHTLILPSSTPELQKDLCDALPKSLENICTVTCENDLFECQEDENGQKNLLVLPGMLAVDESDNADPIVNVVVPEEDTNAEENTEINALSVDASPTKAAENKSPATGFSFRSAVNKQPSDVAIHNSIIEAPEVPKHEETSTSETPVKVGATTSDTKTGGVDKSIIGLVVAGMVVVIAGITIKKNWSSIKKRFSSNTRTPEERNGTNANGTTPEEVPLQDKSPV